MKVDNPAFKKNKLTWMILAKCMPHRMPTQLVKWVKIEKIETLIIWCV